MRPRTAQYLLVMCQCFTEPSALTANSTFLVLELLDAGLNFRAVMGSDSAGPASFNEYASFPDDVWYT